VHNTAFSARLEIAVPTFVPAICSVETITTQRMKRLKKSIVVPVSPKTGKMNALASLPLDLDQHEWRMTGLLI